MVLDRRPGDKGLVHASVRRCHENLSYLLHHAWRPRSSKALPYEISGQPGEEENATRNQDAQLPLHGRSKAVWTSVWERALDERRSHIGDRLHNAVHEKEEAHEHNQ